jgi:acetyltransferase-like isoleucine patch superfamily enzyme
MWMKRVGLLRALGKLFTRAEEFVYWCVQEHQKSRLASCGEDVMLYPGVSLMLPEKIHIGSHTHIGERAHLRGGGEIRIGDWGQIANNVIIATGNHPIDGGLYYGNVECRDVVIGDNVWIASGAIILPGVRIGSNSVIAAGAVVTRDVPENVVAAGVPAKVVRQVPAAKDPGDGPPTAPL